MIIDVIGGSDRDPTRNEVTQLKASIGFYHDASMHLGYSGFVMLEEAECAHSPVTNQHIFTTSSRFGLCF